MLCFSRVAHAGVELVQHARLGRAVLGADHGARGADVVERLHDLGAVGEVLLDGAADLARLRVAGEDAAAVGADVDVLAVERQVVLGVAGAERVLVRRRAHGALDDVRRDLRHGGLAVDRGAVRLEHVERVLRVELDAAVLDHVERGLVDLLHVVLREQLELDALADVALVCVCHRGLLVAQKRPDSTAAMMSSNSRASSAGNSGAGEARMPSATARALSSRRGLPAFFQLSIGAGLAELRLPQLAHVRAGVVVEEVVAVEAHLLDEVDGQRLAVDGDAAQQARDHAEHLVGDHELLERHLRHAVEEAGAEAEVRAGHHLQHQAERVLVGRLRVGPFGLGAAPAETGREAPVARHLALHGAQQQGLRDVGEVRAGAHEEGGRPPGVHQPGARARTAGWP